MATKPTTAEAAAGDHLSSASPSPLPGDELASLRRLLQRAQGFALAFVRSNVPAESAQISDELASSLLDVEVRAMKLSEAITDLHGKLAALEPPLTTGQALVVTGFERSISSGVDFPAALERLNLKRERFRDLPCPLVLVLPDYALDLLTHKAPDFWAWRSGVFETQPIAQRLDTTVLDGKLPTNIGLAQLSQERKHQHLAVLLRTLADLESQGPGAESDRSALNLRIAHLQESLGRLDESHRHAQDALRLAGTDTRARASALGKIADILQARGDLDEAMRIRQEEEIPVYEKIGDVRSRAVTLGKIADILKARGDLDEAMRIRQEEEIPVYEKLGDVRERAVTLGKIADILQARGELDEAMRIRQEEEIPVYEKLGSTRDLLVARANLALIQIERDQAGDRSDAGELLEQALEAAERLRIPEADQIRNLMKAHHLENLGHTSE